MEGWLPQTAPSLQRRASLLPLAAGTPLLAAPSPGTVSGALKASGDFLPSSRQIGPNHLSQRPTLVLDSQCALSP